MQLNQSLTSLDSGRSRLITTEYKFLIKFLIIFTSFPSKRQYNTDRMNVQLDTRSCAWIYVHRRGPPTQDKCCKTIAADRSLKSSSYLTVSCDENNMVWFKMSTDREYRQPACCAILNLHVYCIKQELSKTQYAYRLVCFGQRYWMDFLCFCVPLKMMWRKSAALQTTKLPFQQ